MEQYIISFISYNQQNLIQMSHFIHWFKEIKYIKPMLTLRIACLFVDAVKPPGSSLQAPVELPLAVNTSLPSVQLELPLPPPYQLINVPPLETACSHEDPQDYLLLINCQSKKPEPTR